jgi:hypothetical protein
MPRPNRHLYFAYGSNLSLDQMARRCPNAKPVRAHRLDGWQLAFRRGADIEPAPGGFVMGALWWLSPVCEEVLDHHEANYNRHHFILNGDLPGFGAGAYEMLTYIRKDQSYIHPPPEHYAAKVRRGFADFGLATETLERALLPFAETRRHAHG